MPKKFKWVIWLIPSLVTFMITQFVIQSVTISGVSMAPSLQNNQKVAMSKIDTTYDRGEIVVFKAEGNDPNIAEGQSIYVKRIIGVAGDTVEYKDGNLYVNDRLVNQSYLVDDGSEMINSEVERNSGTSQPLQVNWTLESLSKSIDWNQASRNRGTVPPGTVFVLGDHRSHSKDSRFFGYVSTDSIIGVVKEMPFSNDQVHDVITRPVQEFFDE